MRYLAAALNHRLIAIAIVATFVLALSPLQILDAGTTRRLPFTFESESTRQETNIAFRRLTAITLCKQFYTRIGCNSFVELYIGMDALAIDELLRHIFQYCDRRDNFSNALVSKKWSEEALSALWKHLDAMYPLLSLLAPLVKSKDNSSLRVSIPLVAAILISIL